MTNAAKKLESVSKHEVTLEGEKLVSLISPYWQKGFKSDTHDITKIFILDNHVQANCTMSSFFTSPTDPKFHLSIFNATNFLCQTGIVHALVLNGHARKEVEVLMTDFSVTLTRQLGNPNDIPVKMDIFGHSVTAQSGTRRHPRSFYKWKFDVGEGAWWGTISLCFPF